MKKLNYFTYFDMEGFLTGKKLLTIGQQDWKDFNTGNILGTKVEVVIASDKTDYGNKEGETINNLYEKISVKVPSSITVPMNVEVVLINAEATIYGEFRNQLSVTAENIEVVKK